MNVFRTEFYNGPRVNLDRPELSPCLTGLDKASDRYRNLLAAIRDGQKRLKQRPRGDVMDGFTPHDGDRRNLAHRRKYTEYERRVRRAIREGRQLRDADFAKNSLRAK